MAPMKLARLALLVAVYVSLDVSNPLMPGALTFGVEQSIELRQAERYRGQAHLSAPVPRAPEPERLDRADESRALRRPATPVTSASRPARVMRSHLSSPPAASPSDDH
jgi:hypothetical protein